MLTPILLRSPGGRSGTSLMMELLSSSSKISFDRRHPYEVRMLSYFFRQSQAMFTEKPPGWTNDILVRGDLNLVGPIPIKTSLIANNKEFVNEQFKSSWRNFSKFAISSHCKEFGVTPKYYAEKIPHDILSRLDSVIDSKKIYLTRDPRAELSSIISFNEKRKTSLFGWKPEDTIDTFSERFVSSRRKYYEQIENIEDENSLIVSYESMVVNLPDVCKKLSDFLEVSVTEEQVKKNLDSNSKHMTSKSPSDSLNKWKKHLPEKIRSYVESELLLDVD